MTAINPINTVKKKSLNIFVNVNVCCKGKKKMLNLIERNYDMALKAKWGYRKKNDIPMFFKKTRYPH